MSEWAITPDEYHKLTQFFSQFDKSNSGFIGADSMHKIIQSAKLPIEQCKVIWELSNPSGQPKFSKQMYCVAMQLINRAKKGSRLPPHLPNELKSTCTGNFSRPPIIAEPAMDLLQISSSVQNTSFSSQLSQSHTIADNSSLLKNILDQDKIILEMI